MEISENANVRILFIGAGAVNFGGAEGPWDHSKRLEKIGGVEVVAIADPDLAKAHGVLQSKKLGNFAKMYRNCIVVPDYLQAIEKAKPQVAFIGRVSVCIYSGLKPFCISTIILNKDT